MGRQQRLRKERRQSCQGQTDPARNPFDPTYHPSHQARRDAMAVREQPEFECLVRLPTTFERESLEVSEPFLIQIFGTAQGIKKAILTECEAEINGQTYDHAGVTSLLRQGAPYIGMVHYEGVYS